MLITANYKDIAQKLGIELGRLRDDMSTKEGTGSLTYH